MKFSSSALTSWNDQNFLQKAPPIKKIALLGKKEWDAEIQFTSVSLSVENPQLTFTMPCFARHGRWGNMVFQYIFMRILEWNNNGKIELYKNAYVSPRLSLYKDMMDIAPVQTKSNCVLLDSYHIFFGALSYIPAFLWRGLYISIVRGRQCVIL